VDLSGRRQKTCPSETIWADFSSDCILGTLTNCFQPDDSIAASKVEEDVTEPVGSNTDERTPISPFSEPIVPEIQHSVCNRAAEEGDDCTCEPPAECSICLERCGGTGDGLTQLHCKHVFHSVRLERWLRSRGDCPYCRATVALS